VSVSVRRSDDHQVREALLSGLPGRAEHADDRGPGGVVLPGAEHGGRQLFAGIDEVEARVSEQCDGVGFSACRRLRV
jgi:hypothetical protein